MLLRNDYDPYDFFSVGPEEGHQDLVTQFKLTERRERVPVQHDLARFVGHVQLEWRAAGRRHGDYVGRGVQGDDPARGGDGRGVR